MSNVLAASRPLRLLFFVPYSVYPVSHGGASRFTNTVWGLAKRGHQVHVLSVVRDSVQEEAMRSMPGVASSEAHALPPDAVPFPGGAIPAIVRATHRSRIGSRIGELMREYAIDVVQLEYTQSAAYIPDARSVPVVLVEHDVAFVSSFRRVMRERTPFHAAYRFFDAVRLHRWELEHAKMADLVLTASDREAAILRDRGVTSVSSAVPNGVDVASLAPLDQRREDRDLLFVGSFNHRPNVDGLRFFVTKIWPILQRMRPGLQVSVVGPNLPADLITAVNANGFRYAGYVEDLRAELWSHKVFVVPIRYGAGTRIKVLEASAAKCAMVSTTLGAEGIGLENGRDVLLADDPGTFAAAVVRLVDDEELRVRMGISAQKLVQGKFDWPILVGHLEKLYFELIATGRH